MKTKTNGVYQIFIEDYCYWGSSGNCEVRCATHLKSLKRGDHSNAKMQAVFNKYKSFDFQIIVACDDRDVAYAYEQDYIDAHIGLDKCLNLSAIATAPPGTKGLKLRPLTAKTREKQSAALKGRKHTDETRAKMSAAKKKAPKLQCPHCSRSFHAATFKQWHGDRCKEKTSTPV